MMRLVNLSPALARPGLATSIEGLRQYDIDLMRTLLIELVSHAQRLNEMLARDGTEPMEAPLVVATYTVATLPAAADWTRGVIYVSDETGGATLAFSDGTDWRRVQDRAVVS
jgi:hypothetical protein